MGQGVSAKNALKMFNFQVLAPTALGFEHEYLDIDNWVFCGWILKISQMGQEWVKGCPLMGTMYNGSRGVR